MRLSSPALPFDRIAVGRGAQQVLLSLAQFMRLPLPTRVRYILERDMTFFRGDDLVDEKVAIRALMEGAGQ